MGDVQHQRVGARRDKGLGPVEHVAIGAHRGPDDKAGAGLLNQVDLIGLGFDGHEPVHDADAPETGHGHSHLMLADSVHVGGHDRYPQLDTTRQPRAHRHVLAGPDRRPPWDDQDIIEGETRADLSQSHDDANLQDAAGQRGAT